MCVLHVLRDVNDLIVKAVRRRRRGLARRGNAGRQRRRGRPSRAQRARRRRRGPTAKEKAAFVFRHRHLIVKRLEALGKAGWDDLVQRFDYLPELRVLWRFASDLRDLFAEGLSPQTAWRRRAALLREEDYRRVPELLEAMGMLAAEKFAKMVAFVYSPAGRRVRTNNHVERANRRLRFAEKVRYKWRRRRWVVRYVVLALDRWWSEAAQGEAAEESGAATPTEPRPKSAKPQRQATTQSRRLAG